MSEPVTEAMCPPETIASDFRMIDDYEEKIKTHTAKIQQLMEMLQLEAGPTFRFEGQLYQVCQRKKEGTFFFKRLDKPPKAWLGRKAREARARYRSTPDLAVQGESVQTDVEEVCGTSDLSSSTPEAEASPEGATVAALATE